jgi:hypothetical protein
MFRKFLAAVLAIGTLSLLGAGSVGAQRQTGLVNINVSDNTIQVPIAIAANICDVSVIALASDIRDDGETTCTALSTSTAEATVTPGTGGAASQDGLINVNLQNNTIQVPIAAAANICDVDVVLLATEILFRDATGCRARADADGIIYPPATP